MKKTLCIIIAFLMITAFFGCGKTDNKHEHEAAEDTSLSYPEVCLMLQQPEDFAKKTVTVSGKCSVHGDPAGGNDHYFCTVEDADGCSEEVEFILKDSYAYPDGYPQKGDSITVSGKYASFENNGYTSYRIENAEITVN